MSDTLKERLWQSIARRLQNSSFWQRMASHVSINDPVIAAKLYPYDDSALWWTNNVPSAPSGLSPLELPVPPPELWEGTGYGKTPEEYLASGKAHVGKMLEILARDGVPIERTKRVLDFGGSAGRMLRWLAPYAEGRELWGVDIGSKAIHWAQAHLSPPFHFACTTTNPHLPFEERSFDLIYAGSVFSHIADLADAWLLELRRLLKPGGVLYLTIHDKHSLELLLGVYQTKLSRWLRKEDEEHGYSKHDFAKLVIARTPRGAQTFYDGEWIRRHWGRYLDVVSVNSEAYGYQTALVLRKTA